MALPGCGNSGQARLVLEKRNEILNLQFRTNAIIYWTWCDNSSVWWKRGIATNPLIGSVHECRFMQGAGARGKQVFRNRKKLGLLTDCTWWYFVYWWDWRAPSDSKMNKYVKGVRRSKSILENAYYRWRKYNDPNIYTGYFPKRLTSRFSLIRSNDTIRPEEIPPVFGSRCFRSTFFRELDTEEIQKVAKNARKKWNANRWKWYWDDGDVCKAMDGESD